MMLGMDLTPDSDVLDALDHALTTTRPAQRKPVVSGGQVFIGPLGTQPTGLLAEANTLMNKILNRRHPMFRPGTRQRVECVVCGRDTAVRPGGRQVASTDTYPTLADVTLTTTDDPRLYRHRLRDAPTVAGLFDGDWCPGSGAVVSVPNTWAPWDVPRDKQGQWLNVGYLAGGLVQATGQVTYGIEQNPVVVYETEWSATGPARMRLAHNYVTLPVSSSNIFKIISTT